MPRPTRVGDALVRHPAVHDARRLGCRVPRPRVRRPGTRAVPTQRLGRHAERGRGEREALDALLDEVLAGTLSTVVDGRPWVVPMLFARDGDRVLLHGSTGAGALRQVAAGAPGGAQRHRRRRARRGAHDLRVVGQLPLRGRSTASSPPSSDAERTTALELISQRLIPGRPAEVRAMTRREEAATLAMALPITAGRWLLKERSGGPSVPEEETDAWSGVVPFRVRRRRPRAARRGRPRPALRCRPP